MGTIEIVSTDYSIFAAFYEDLFVFQFCYIYWIIEHAEETTQAGSGTVISNCRAGATKKVSRFAFERS